MQRNNRKRIFCFSEMNKKQFIILCLQQFETVSQNTSFESVHFKNLRILFSIFFSFMFEIKYQWNYNIFYFFFAYVTSIDSDFPLYKNINDIFIAIRFETHTSAIYTRFLFFIDNFVIFFFSVKESSRLLSSQWAAKKFYQSMFIVHWSECVKRWFWLLERKQPTLYLMNDDWKW